MSSTGDDSTGPTPKRSRGRTPVTIDLPATSAPPQPPIGDADEAVAATAPPTTGAEAAAVPVEATAAAEAAARPEDSTAAAPSEETIATAAADAPAASAFGGASDEATAERGETAVPPVFIPPAEPKRGGFGAGIAGGIVAAVLLAGGAYALVAGGVVPMPGGDGGLAERVATLEAEADPAAAAAVDGLEQRVTQLSESVDRLAAGGPDDLRPRLDELEGTVGALRQQPPPEPDLSAVDAALAALGSRLDGLEAELGAVSASGQKLADDLAALPQRVTALEDGSRALTTTIDALTAEITALRQAVEEAQRPGAGEVAFAATSLQAALAEGRPYAVELAVLGTTAIDETAIEPLRPFAESGAPTGPALAREFEAVARGWAPAAVGSEGGFLDTIVANARSLVTVRSHDAADGDGTEAVASRLHAALEGGRFDEALGLWRELPEADRAAAAAFGDRLAARAAAATAADALARDAVAGLAAPSAAPAPTE